MNANTVGTQSSLSPRRFVWWVCFAGFAAFAFLVSAQTRPRARDLGIVAGIYPPGALNAITDVGGVRVGHTTIVEGERVRTGVTAILPHGGNVFQDKVAGAVFVGNAFGKLAGSTQVNELGTIEARAPVRFFVEQPAMRTCSPMSSSSTSPPFPIAPA